MITRGVLRVPRVLARACAGAPCDCRGNFYEGVRGSYLVYELGVREVVHRRVAIDRGTRRTGFRRIPVRAVAVRWHRSESVNGATSVLEAVLDQDWMVIILRQRIAVRIICLN